MKNRVGCMNLQMNDRTFTLRRQAIAFVYEAKKLYPMMPRVEVRIVKDQKSREGDVLLGRATTKGVKHISITEKAFQDDELRQVVFHELIHTVFGFGHDESCPLMCAAVTKSLSKKECHEIFANYLKEYTKRGFYNEKQ